MATLNADLVLAVSMAEMWFEWWVRLGVGISRSFSSAHLNGERPTPANECSYSSLDSGVCTWDL